MSFLLNRLLLRAVLKHMNAKFCRILMAGLISSLGVSCTTAYDAYGYPQQVVDPTTAVVGAAAVGLLAYGLADHHNHYDRRYYGRNYYRGHNPYYYRSGGYNHRSHRGHGHGHH